MAQSLFSGCSLEGKPGPGDTHVHAAAAAAAAAADLRRGFGPNHPHLNQHPEETPKQQAPGDASLDHHHLHTLVLLIVQRFHQQ